jgi:hypothetical protein
MKHYLHLKNPLIIGTCLLLSSHGLWAQTASDALYINQAGNVGIGAPAPETKLHVAGEGEVEISLQSTGTGGKRFTLQSGPRSTDRNALFQIIDRTANTCRMAIDSVGNIGINTTSPGKKLDVNGDIRSNKMITAQGLSVSDSITAGKTITALTLNATNINASKIITANSLRADGGTFLFSGGTVEGTTNVVLHKNAENAHIFPFGTGTTSNMLVIGGGLSANNPGLIVTGNTQLRGSVSIDKEATFYDFVEMKGNRSMTPPYFRYFSKETPNGDYYVGHSTKDKWGISLKADNAILSPNFFAYSDMRIKKDLQQSDASSDLAILKRLQVTDYKHIDVMNYGRASKKGFIAQQVEGVFAEAVQKRSDFVPDIFSAPEKVAAANNKVMITMAKPHQLANGDEVRIYTSTGVKETTVTLVSAYSFSVIGTSQDYAEAFVFGKKVNDFRIVDYDRLFTLNVSATQELSRKVEKLERENEKMKNAYDDLSEKVSRLEAMIPGTNNKAAVITSR